MKKISFKKKSQKPVKNHFFKKNQKKLKKGVDIWGRLTYNMSCVGQRSTNK